MLNVLAIIHFVIHHNYRPQRSWGKVMFLHVSVILSTISGGRRRLYGWQAGGTHPTGMLPCCSIVSYENKTEYSSFL